MYAPNRCTLRTEIVKRSRAEQWPNHRYVSPAGLTLTSSFGHWSKTLIAGGRLGPLLRLAPANG
jgi:hypothetical protein